VSYPGTGGPWQPNDPNQPGSGQFPAQPGYPQQGYPQGYPQQGYPQSGPQPTQQYPGYQTGPQPTQQYPGYQAGPQQPGLGYGQQPNYGGLGTPPPPKKRGKGPIFGAVAAVLVVAVGVATTIFVLNRSSQDDAGKANPTEAATNLVNSLSKGDVLGVLESLTPAESSLLVDFNAKSTTGSRS